jgi:hypothetical protein
MMKMCYDVFYDSFMDEEVPSESTNVGLEVENYKFTMGDKGRITTTHCQYNHTNHVERAEVVHLEFLRVLNTVFEFPFLNCIFVNEF